MQTPNSSAMSCSHREQLRTGLRIILAFPKVKLQHFRGGTQASLRSSARRWLTLVRGLCDIRTRRRYPRLREPPGTSSGSWESVRPPLENLWPCGVIRNITYSHKSKITKIILEGRRQSGTWIGIIYALDTYINVSVDSPMSPLEAWLVILNQNSVWWFSRTVAWGTSFCHFWPWNPHSTTV